MNRQFAEFTESRYESLLRRTRAVYRFEPFGTRENRAHVLWRHDVDLSVHRALRIAEIEQVLRIRSTYFFLLHSEFYNLLERAVAARVRKIAEMGHYIGLHFDQSYYAPVLKRQELERRLAQEKRLLEDLCGRTVHAFSLHDPQPRMLRALADDRIAGMINVYGPRIRSHYEYCSDSNGFWRHKRVADVVANGVYPRLHVLIHPEWWVPVPMSPWKRMKRCVDGRADFAIRLYDRSLKKDRRLNLGKPK